MTRDLSKEKFRQKLVFSHKNFQFDCLSKLNVMMTPLLILRELSLNSSSRMTPHCWGFFDGRVLGHTMGKWADTQYRLCGRYILGRGYVLGHRGRDLVQYVADNSRMLELLNIEDASVGT